jgi:hypothetical protein
LLIYFLHLSIVFSVDTAARGNYHSRRSLFGVVDCWGVLQSLRTFGLSQAFGTADHRWLHIHRRE